MKFFTAFAALAMATTSAVRIQEKTEESEAIETQTTIKTASQEFADILNNMKTKLNENQKSRSEAATQAQLEARLDEQEKWVNDAIDTTQDFLCRNFGWCWVKRDTFIRLNL